ncbi:Leucyl aminopeptidase yscIV [Tilletia horrida]|nr:Leucyl aminopeptidase yscIV [Tilletia horrida]
MLSSKTVSALEPGVQTRMNAGDLVAVIGCTGTGKSKLAVELAQHAQALAAAQRGRDGSPYARAEVISADSMQVYHGLDVITNKATEDEMGGITHHLMSFLPAGEEYTIKDFTGQAGTLIEGMHASQPPVLPVIAGGTSYYVQHLLFPGRLVSAEEGRAEPITPKSLAQEAVEAALALPATLQESWARFLAMAELSQGPTPTSAASAGDELSSQELWTLLNALDPPMAPRWHPNDDRKILRSLTVFATTGKRHSDWLLEQDQEEQKLLAEQTVDAGTSRLSRMRRLFFWVWCEPETLKDRLDKRIHKMIERGLLDEIRELRKLANSMYEQGGPDYTRGIFQAIGFKEFDAFLSYMDAQPSSSKTGANTSFPELDARAQDLFNVAVESMQRGTRQYARRQTAWIRNQLLPEIRKARQQMSVRKEAGVGDVEVFLLDATDLDQWEGYVSSVAKDILERFLTRKPLPDPTALNSAAAEQLFNITPLTSPTTEVKGTGPPSTSLSAKAFVPCPTCSPADPLQPPFLVRASEMEGHLRSRRHRMAVKKATKQQYEEGKKAEAAERRRLAAQAGAGEEVMSGGKDESSSASGPGSDGEARTSESLSKVQGGDLFRSSVPRGSFPNR